MHKYGREFSLAVMENRDGCVSKRVRFRHALLIYSLLIWLLKIISKLSVDTPSPALVDGYLKEIAKAYGAPFSIPGEEVNEVVDENQIVINDDKACSSSYQAFFGH